MYKYINIMNSKREYIEDHLTTINQMINDKRPKMEIARVLGVKYETINKYLKEMGIKYSGNPNRKGISHPNERTKVNKYLTDNMTTSTSSTVIRKKLIEEGIKEEKCECCGRREWMGRKIPLELHHINMNHYDNRLENLQILCSNCHSLVHNYGNIIDKNSNEIFDDKEKTDIVKDKKTCPVCQKTFFSEKKQKYCSNECAKKASERFSPSKEELIDKIKELKSYVKVGKFYGVTDASIKKRCKREGIYDEIYEYIIHRNNKSNK